MSFLKKILFMLFSHKLSSSSTMVPFQTFLTSDPINKIILLASTHTAHTLSSMLAMSMSRSSTHLEDVK